MNVPKSSLDSPHFPVMINEVLETCHPVVGRKFLDCTFGGGGYSKEILKHPKTKVLAIDRDIKTKNFAEKIKKKYLGRFLFSHERFSNLDKILKNEDKIDIIIFDLGLSSTQLLDSSRGFSFNSEGSIDMNMGLAETSVEKVINEYNESDLKLIIKIFGEEKEAAKIASNIVKSRKQKKISTVPQLVQIIKKSKKKNYKKKINICTKTFQALRIFVNREITELIEGISKAAKVLKEDGKIIVISFHSIEDKIVKFFFSNYSSNRSNSSRYFPSKKKDERILFKDFKKKPLIASHTEVHLNPKSRSAKLRYAVRNNNDFFYPKELIDKFEKYLKIEKLNGK